jgi:hypothetical protein
VGRVLLDEQKRNGERVGGGGVGARTKNRPSFPFSAKGTERRRARKAGKQKKETGGRGSRLDAKKRTEIKHKGGKKGEEGKGDGEGRGGCRWEGERGGRRAETKSSPRRKIKERQKCSLFTRANCSLLQFPLPAPPGQKHPGHFLEFLKPPPEPNAPSSDVRGAASWFFWLLLALFFASRLRPQRGQKALEEHRF